MRLTSRLHRLLACCAVDTRITHHHHDQHLSHHPKTRRGGVLTISTWMCANPVDARRRISLG